MTPLTRRSIVRLLSGLEATCGELFTMDALTEAVTASYDALDAELRAFVQAEVTRACELRPSEVAGVLLNNSGTPVELFVGQDTVAPDTFAIRVGSFGDYRLCVHERQLPQVGRYGRLFLATSRDFERGATGILDGAEELLTAGQVWIEERLYIAVERFTETIGAGVYTLLSAADEPSIKDRVDVALIGARRGWRIPNEAQLHRTLDRYKSSPGRNEAHQLTASFVSTHMPRDELLMAKALENDGPVVLPFRKAGYFTAGSYFGIACQLRHAGDAGPPRTSKLHPIYRSDRLSVVLVYDARDTHLEERVSGAQQDLERHVEGHLDSFMRAVEFFEGPSSSEQKTQPRENVVRLMRLLTTAVSATSDDSE